ncbi:MAG: hypothetical protein K8H88_08920, partial [Sandaracinaceae bacterium]|nr:hypothetical protein [Sandaracinaceae bacterium]
FDLAPFAGDLLPGIGVSSAMQGRDERMVSIGALGAWSGRLTGVGVSGVADVIEADLQGVQIGGVVAYASGAAGAQLGGVIAFASNIAGAQIGGVVSLAHGPARGLQIGGVVAYAGEDLAGVQLAGVLAFAGRRAEGGQVAVVNLAMSGLTGVQVGAVNASGGETAGAQIGVVNFAGGGVSGAQIGVVNVAEDADAQLGLVNIATRGRAAVRAGADTTGIFGASFVYGSRYTHTIVSAAVNPLSVRLAGAFGLGLGVRLTPEEPVHVDIDVVAHVLLDEVAVNGRDPAWLFSPRVVVSAPVVGVFGVYGSVGYTWAMHRDPPILGPALVTDFSADVHGWPVLEAGIQLGE